MIKISESIGKYIEGTIVFFLSLFFKTLHRELSPEATALFIQFVKFAVVGISNSIISYGLYVASLCGIQRTIPFEKDYLAAQMIAFCLSVLWSFYWNNKMVFVTEDGGRRIWWKALLKTYAYYSLTGLFLNGALLMLWIDVCHLSKYLAPVLNLIIGLPMNFMINKFCVYTSRMIHYNSFAPHFTRLYCSVLYLHHNTPIIILPYGDKKVYSLHQTSFL